MYITLVNGINTDDKWIQHEKSIIDLCKDLENNGHTVDILTIRDMNMHYCQGCWDCWTKTPGICRMKDDGEKYLKALKQSDLLLYCSPVIAGFISNETKKALDRFIPNALPFISIYEGECHHINRYPEKTADMGIILLDDGNIHKKSSEIIFKNFDRIQKNMRSKRVIKYIFKPETKKELYNEIINN